MITRITYDITTDNNYTKIIISDDTTESFSDFIFAFKLEECNTLDVSQINYSEGSFMACRDIYIERRYQIMV